ncbi:MAG: DUF167 domain-containing protein [Dehalococcoidia bacterium]|nr:DUF167 domain-containing protein [Dehalococcoidia bacterium]
MARQENQPKKTSPTETRLALHVQPNAKRSEILGLANGVVRVRVAALAKEGRANEALIEFLSSLLGVPKTRIRILRGLTARNKVVAVQGLSQEEAMERLLAR